MERISLDHSYILIAEIVARRGTCSRLHVGAVLVREGRIAATGYNGAPAGQPHCRHDLGMPSNNRSDTPTRPGYVYPNNEALHHASSNVEQNSLGNRATPTIGRRCTDAIHAERNTIGYAARFGVVCGGATLYLTHEPCWDCASVLIAAGIERVVYQHKYGTGDGVTKLELNGIQVDQFNM